MQIPTHLISPVSVMEPEWFKSEGDDGLRGFKCFGFMTSFHGIGNWIRSFPSAKAFLDTRTRTADLIKMGLE
jgi:hypothetical protein